MVGMAVVLLLFLCRVCEPLGFIGHLPCSLHPDRSPFRPCILTLLRRGRGGFALRSEKNHSFTAPSAACRLCCESSAVPARRQLGSGALNDRWRKGGAMSTVAEQLVGVLLQAG